MPNPINVKSTVEKSPNALIVVARDFEVIDFRDREGQVLGADAQGGLADVDQPIRFSIDERTEQHAPDDAENRRVGADAQGERHDHRGGQGLGAEERAQGEPGISPERLTPSYQRLYHTRRISSRTAGT